MLYFIAVLLLILVLAYEKSRALLFLLLVGIGGLAIVGGSLYGVFLLYVRLSPRKGPVPVTVSPAEWDVQGVVGLVLGGLFLGVCLYYLFKEGRKGHPPY